LTVAKNKLYLFLIKKKKYKKKNDEHRKTKRFMYRNHIIEHQRSSFVDVYSSGMGVFPSTFGI